MGLKQQIELSAKQMQELKHLLQEYLPGVEVWAFGSRVKGTAHPVSDLDIVIFAGDNCRIAVEELREALQQSDLPFRVDMHVWDDLPETYRETIREQPTVRISESEK